MELEHKPTEILYRLVKALKTKNIKGTQTEHNNHQAFSISKINHGNKLINTKTRNNGR
jgi:hypothetical protein